MAERSFSVNVSDLEELTAGLLKMRERFPRDATETLTELGLGVKKAAETIARPHSEKVADSVRMEAGPQVVAVQAGGADLPIAGLWEYGNKGGGDSKTFEHPVFGDPTVVAVQPRHPFLKRADDELYEANEELIETAFDKAHKPLGFKPDKRI